MGGKRTLYAVSSTSTFAGDLKVIVDDVGTSSQHAPVVGSMGATPTCERSVALTFSRSETSSTSLKRLISTEVDRMIALAFPAQLVTTA